MNLYISNGILSINIQPKKCHRLNLFFFITQMKVNKAKICIKIDGFHFKSGIELFLYNSSANRIHDRRTPYKVDVNRGNGLLLVG